MVKQIQRRRRLNADCTLWKFTIQSLKQRTGRNNPFFFSFLFFFSILYCGEQRLFLTYCPSHPVHWFPMISTVWCIDSTSLSCFFVKISSLQDCHLRTCGSKKKSIWKVVWKIWIHLPSLFLPLIDWEFARASLDCLTQGTLQEPCPGHTQNLEKDSSIS